MTLYKYHDQIVLQYIRKAIDAALILQTLWKHNEISATWFYFENALPPNRKLRKTSNLQSIAGEHNSARSN